MVKKVAKPLNGDELIDMEIARAEAIKRRRFNPFRAVMGKNPTPVEMATWSHDKWMDFLRFTAIFIGKDKKEEESFKFTDENRKQADDFLKIPNHPFHEWIYRVNKWPEEDSNSDFRFKFQSITRVVLGYLKAHPSIIDSNMRVLISAYPKRLGWVLSQYTTAQTRAGELLTRDTSTDNSVPVALPSIQTKLMNSLVLMADIYERIAASVSDKDIPKMLLSEKLKALKDLSFVFSTASKKQQTNHLTQININTKDAKGAEEAMMSYIKKTQDKNE
jgi:hypothetical protein